MEVMTHYMYSRITLQLKLLNVLINDGIGSGWAIMMALI